MKKLDMQATSLRIRELCEINNVTAYKLSKAANISIAATYMWLRGERMPSIDSLIVLTDIFKCKIDDIVRTEE